jgi:hypothetical protein
LDSDSSNFSWAIENGEKVRNPEFPANYIEHIKENIGKYKYIFVSSHEEVREALFDACIFFYLVYPEDRRKEEFLQRYVDRGSPEGFVNLISNNWDKWQKEMSFIDHGCEKIRLVLDNLEDELNHLERADNGDILDDVEAVKVPWYAVAGIQRGDAKPKSKGKI